MTPQTGSLGIILHHFIVTPLYIRLLYRRGEGHNDARENQGICFFGFFNYRLAYMNEHTYEKLFIINPSKGDVALALSNAFGVGLVIFSSQLSTPDINRKPWLFC
jgi:hypothetical protein